MQELDDPKGPVTPQPETPQGQVPAQEHEPQPPFAPAANSTASLSFREDSANLPAPAPFQVIGQTPAVQAPAPFSSQLPTAPTVAEQETTETPTTPPADAVPSMSSSPAPAPSLSDPAISATPVAKEPSPFPVETQPMPTLRPGAADLPTSPVSAAAASLPEPSTPAALPQVTPQTPNTPPPYQGPNDGARRLQQAVDVMSRLRQRMRAQILGRDDVIDLVLVALLADGHVLLEDFPGSGKTTLAKSLGSSIVNPPAGSPEEDDGIADFRRIQFTPDLLPSDVTGVSVFDVNTHRFDFRRGPIFAHVVLADEINRTSPKVQSAMLEAMAEKQVTVDNVTYPLDPLFFVMATQNPLDLAGTYPLPVAQLDRFLFKIRMHHIDRQAELEVLNTYRQRRDMERQDLPKVTRLDVLAARRAIDELVAIEQPVKECLVDIAHRLRGDERVLQGNSTRSLVLILPALQALATLRGRDFVSADDIQTLIPRVLGHRVELAPGVTDMDQVLTEVMEGPIEALSRSTLRRR